MSLDSKVKYKLRIMQIFNKKIKNCNRTLSQLSASHGKQTNASDYATPGPQPVFNYIFLPD